MIARFAGPSFHEASRLPASCARVGLVRSKAGIGSKAAVARRTRRLTPEAYARDFMLLSLRRLAKETADTPWGVRSVVTSCRRRLFARVTGHLHILNLLHDL